MSESKEKIVEELQGKVPKETEVNVPQSRKDMNYAVQSANSNAVAVLLNILREGEEKRLNQQKPLIKVICWFVGVQLFAFNGIIIALLIQWWGIEDIQIIEKILDFLKYYIGAVLVELIGMVVFIAKSTFTSFTKTIIEKLLPGSHKKASNVNEAENKI